MAPLFHGPAHLLGIGAFAVCYGIIRTIFLFALVAYVLGVVPPMPTSAMVVLVFSSISFVGIGADDHGMPLISSKKAPSSVHRSACC